MVIHLAMRLILLIIELALSLASDVIWMSIYVASCCFQYAPQSIKPETVFSSTYFISYAQLSSIIESDVAYSYSHITKEVMGKLDFSPGSFRIPTHGSFTSFIAFTDF